jgi:hypothetical protein
MNSEILDPCATASRFETNLDPTTRTLLISGPGNPFIGLAIGTPENASIFMRKVGQFYNEIPMKGNTPRGSIFGFLKLNMSPI